MEKRNVKNRNIAITEERRSFWRSYGLVLDPVSERQALAAMAARQFVDSLKMHEEVRQMLAGGRRVMDVAKFVKDESSESAARALKLVSVAKSLQIYRRFLIPAWEFGREGAPQKMVEAKESQAEQKVLRTGVRAESSVSSAVLKKLESLEVKVPEVAWLQNMVEKQAARIEAQIQKEMELQGFALPGIRLELLAYKELLHDLVEMKTSLGYPGYMKVPQRFSFSAERSDAMLKVLSGNDRKQLRDVGGKILTMIEMARKRGEQSDDEEARYEAVEDVTTDVDVTNTPAQDPE